MDDTETPQGIVKSELDQWIIASESSWSENEEDEWRTWAREFAAAIGLVYRRFR